MSNQLHARRIKRLEWEEEYTADLGTIFKSKAPRARYVVAPRTVETVYDLRGWVLYASHGGAPPRGYGGLARHEAFELANQLYARYSLC